MLAEAHDTWLADLVNLISESNTLYDIMCLGKMFALRNARHSSALINILRTDDTFRRIDAIGYFNTLKLIILRVFAAT